MRSAKFTRYKPKRWHPEFDLIVLDSFSGSTNEEIGKKFGYTKEHISNILCCEEANNVRARLREKVDLEITGNVSSRLGKISEQAIKKIEDFISNDSLATASPFLFVDRAIQISKLAGIGPSESNSKIEINQNIQNNNLGNEVIDRIALALEKANEVKQLHSGLDPSKEVKTLNK